MKLHRFIGDFDLSKPTLFLHDGTLINQIKNVLRLTVGEQIVLVTGFGLEAVVVIEGLNKDELSVKILDKKENLSESKRFVTLYCSVLKRENFELVAQKAVECGVKKIVPIISDRTVKTGLKIDRIEKIIKEASEQCGRALVPELGNIVILAEALNDSKINGVNLFFDASGEPFETKKLLNSVGIFVGPEGGWTEQELILAKESGCQIVSLGALTLRGETAAIISSYLATR